MKTTIDIADDLLRRIQGLARREGTTFRALTEEGLRWVLEHRQETRDGPLPPLVTYDGGGVTDEFEDWNWDRIRDEQYRGRGA